jgi:hypothetical protein
LEWLTTITYAYGKGEHWITMLQDFQFKIIHCVRSQHLSIDALNKNHVDFLKKDEDFECDAMEQEDKPGVTPSPIKNDSTNEAIINLFILQHIDQEINDVEAHLARSECDGQSVDFFSKEELLKVKTWWMKPKIDIKAKLWK